MALRIRRFLNDEAGTSFEGIALSVSILAVAFVASADMLDFATKSDSPNSMTAQHVVPGAVPATVANMDLDRTPTASTNGALPEMISRSVLDPCTGRMK